MLLLKNLVELFEPIQGLLTDEEIDVIFRLCSIVLGTQCIGCHRYIPIVAHALLRAAFTLV